MTRAMKAANKPQYFAIMLLGFLCLATYSYGQRNEDYASRAEFGALLDKSMGGAAERKVVQAPPAKPVILTMKTHEKTYEELVELADNIKAGKDVETLYDH